MLSRLLQDGARRLVGGWQLPSARTFSTGTRKSTVGMESTQFSPQSYVVGKYVDHSLDLTQASVGQRIMIPYELTVSPGYRDIWQSSFYSYDRINTSKPFASMLGYQDSLLPYTMMLFLTGSMSHVDVTSQVMDLGFHHAVFEQPAYAGDSFRKSYTIENLRPTSDGNNIVATILCELFNSQHRVFSLKKVMLFPKKANVPASNMQPRMTTLHAESHTSDPSSKRSSMPKSKIRTQLIRSSDKLPSPQNLLTLNEDELILHSYARPLGLSTNMGLSTLFRITHPLHFDLQRYRREELLVSGGLILSATLAASSRDLYETLYEEIIDCSFLNKVNPSDTIGAMSFIKNIRDLDERHEEITLKTIGVKDFDMLSLEETEIPVELFTSHQLKPAVYELICKRHIPILQNKIVAQAHRRIIRQKPKNFDSTFLL